MTLYEYLLNNHNQLAINEKNIIQIEERFNIVFSINLRNFFMNYNGTQIPLCSPENFSWLEVSSLVPIKYGVLPLEKIMEWNYADGFIKNGLIPIATDRGGNIYYCDTNNNDNILFIDHEDIENPEVVDSDVFSFLQHLIIIDE